MGLRHGGPEPPLWEADSRGAASLCRPPDVFEETEVLRNRPGRPFKVRGRKKRWMGEEDSGADVGFRQSFRQHLSTGDGQHFTVGEDGSAAMKVHQVLQKAVVPLLPHDDVTAVRHRIDHEMSAAVRSSDGRSGERGEGEGGGTS